MNSFKGEVFFAVAFVLLLVGVTTEVIYQQNDIQKHPENHAMAPASPCK